MLKMHLAAGLATAALMTTAALAQTSPTPSPTATQTQAQTASASGGSGQFITQMSPNVMRGSRLMGVDVYGSDNQKIGDIDEVLVDREGKIHAVVVGIGGFLGIGEKNVAIPFNQVQWMTDDQARTAAGGAGGVTTPGSPGGTAGTTGQPATTGSTGAGGTTAGGTGATTESAPARAMVRMSKADLQNAPEFRYAGDAARTGGGAGGTTPPASPARPGTAPQQ
ncbi:MAG TPA: PRC-barrel domain-containing protein [Microvirga sp.]|jgi:sporulation protein YlmC with PRC-barrel domain|nr:PRC-barrel domain-containing protein [Microvirga sp.]